MKKSSKTKWQHALINMITSAEVLLEKLKLDKTKYLNAGILASKNFNLKVTESFVSRMEKGNPNDPLLLQVLPLHLELKKTKGFSSDPLMEKQANPISGLLHKYQNRVLVNLISQCAIHCRYCFRREFPYEDNNPGKKGWEKIFHYILEHPNVNEIILSGADPLTASDALLDSFLEQLQKLPQIKTLRIHSRVPIVLPERITRSLIQILKKIKLRKVLVLHTNHPNEINAEIITKLHALKKANITLLNQSVLLKNINDNAETLAKLSEKCFDAGVLPYYLHVLDKVNGTKHFEISDNKARQLILQLQERLPGYLVPKLVREVPEKKHKIML